MKTVITFDPFTPTESITATLESSGLKVVYIGDLEKAVSLIIILLFQSIGCL